MDHLRNSHSVHLDGVEVLILDEADRLLDMGFKEEVRLPRLASPHPAPTWPHLASPRLVRARVPPSDRCMS